MCIWPASAVLPLASRTSRQCCAGWSGGGMLTVASPRTTPPPSLQPEAPPGAQRCTVLIPSQHTRVHHARHTIPFTHTQSPPHTHAHTRTMASLAAPHPPLPRAPSPSDLHACPLQSTRLSLPREDHRNLFRPSPPLLPAGTQPSHVSGSLPPQPVPSAGAEVCGPFTSAQRGTWQVAGPRPKSVDC